MEKEKLETLLIDYIDGALSETDRKTVDNILKADPDALALYEQLKEVMHVLDRAAKVEPSLKMKAGFDAMLKKEIKDSKKVIAFTPAFLYRVAAAVALLVVGVSAGFYVSQYQQQQQKLAAIEKEMRETKLMLMSMLDNDLSASQRVQGATVAYTIDKADTEILSALIKAMNEDPNTNVRLTALEALGKFHKEPIVRKALIASLTTQKDPVVQISLIRLLVEMKEKSTIQELERITNDDDVTKEVKDEAHVGLMRLS